jgi:queuine tRNA-ribosyltransferase
MRLASVHNLHYYLDLTRGAREALLNGSFSGYYKEFHETLELGRGEGFS